VRGLVGLILGAAQTEHLLGFTPRDSLGTFYRATVRAARGRLSGLSIFPMKIHFVWGFCMGARGA
jgi:hypothetical protein